MDARARTPDRREPVPPRLAEGASVGEGRGVTATALEALLPRAPLPGEGAVSRAFREAGRADLVEAAALLWRTPYGRNARPKDPLAPLREGRGTCSTKHALLHLAAREAGVETRLLVGVYLMDEANTPGVGPVLAAHGLDAIPEAHCVVERRGRLVDVTSPDATEPECRLRFLETRAVEPGQLGAWKVEFHRRFLDRWRPEGRRLDDLWRVREACIAALGAPSAAAPASAVAAAAPVAPADADPGPAGRRG